MKKLNFGVIGLGMGAGHAAKIAQMETTRLVTVADINEARAREIGEKHGVAWSTDYRQLLQRDDIDAIVVATPNGLHASVGIDGAKAGKHVFTEKPIDASLERADEFIDACRQAGVKLGVNFQNRFASANMKIKRYINSGHLGRLIIGEARIKWHRSQKYYNSGSWRGTWDLEGGGSLINQGVHYVDLLQWFMGPVQSVLGQIAVLTHDIQTEDFSSALLKFKSGAVGTILSTTSIYRKLGPDEPEWIKDESRIELHGERGNVVTLNNRIEVLELAEEVEDVDKQESPFTDALEDFVDAVLNKREPLVNGEEGRKSLEIITAVYRSAQEKGEVRLPLS